MFLNDIILDQLINKSVLLAHSSGVDSCVLAHIFLNKKINFSVAHCNFQLRGEESENDLLFVKDWCKKNKIPFFYKTFDTKKFRENKKIGIQEAARDLRYQWFALLMNKNNFQLLTTAHHLNDQFETFMINITRGSGIQGLLGIPSNKKCIRPLNDVSKKDILKFAKENKIQWREDSSNYTHDYLRNKIRHQLISPIEEIKPKALENFKNTLGNLRDAKDFIEYSLNELKKKLFIEKDDVIKIPLNKLNEIEPLNFCLHHLFSPFGFVSKEVKKLLKSNSGKKLLNDHFRLIRDRNYLLLSPLRSKINDEILINLDKNIPKLPIPINFEVNVKSIKDKWDINEAFLDKDRLKKPICIRKYKKGDYFCPTGMRGKKLLSKFFKDEKYSLLDKEQQWLLCSQDEIVWVIGRRCDRRFIANSKTNNKLLIRLSE
tara:strand:+ start:989 stop:2281 length:1293 start_codon:yes stop_codon:yes gene_type:complete